MNPNIGTMPARGGFTAPTSAAIPQPNGTLAFEGDPTLRDLLHPDVVIRPGVEYLACALVNVPRAEGEGFRTMANQRSFQIRGVSCVVMTRGKPIPGGRDSSQIVTLQLDKACDPRHADGELNDEELERVTAPETGKKSK